MTNRHIFFLIGLALAATVFVVLTINEWISPTKRALKKAKKGDVPGAEADLKAILQKNGDSAAAHDALGQVYLLANRPRDAVSELQRSVELGRRTAGTLSALGWGLVRLERFEEALPVADEANKKANEDFEVYCLYCGLMAHQGRAGEVVSLYEFLKKTAAQIQKMRASAFQGGLAEKYEFAKSQMGAAGYS